MDIRPFGGHIPQLASDSFVDKTAVLIGDIVLGAESSVWPLCVLRGDVNTIRIGCRSNIQDGSVLHVSHPTAAKPEGSPLVIGNEVTIGHRAMLHGCTIGSRVLVGMGTIVLDDAEIGSDTVIGAGSLVPPRKRLAGGFLYMGAPVRQIRALTEAEREHLRYSAGHYVKLAALHRQ
nr:gamma carbonic anhydrase family protein [uncultured Kingella sp.]